MYLARKLYGSGNLKGHGGILPPTDPRLKDLTVEQIELDILLYLEDHPEMKKGRDAYTDTEYEEAIEEDLANAGPPPAPVEEELPPVNDWVDADESD